MDFAKLIIWVLRNYDDVEPIILSGEYIIAVSMIIISSYSYLFSFLVDEKDEVTIARVAALIAQALEFNGTLKFDINAADGQIKKTASNAKLRRLMKEKFEFTPLEKAIRETVKWFETNYPAVRR